MEQNHYNDEFEKMLRESTDDFRMYPSRKVWHSIYNDLHPDRKWPSLAVCLLLLMAILHIGVSNNNSISKNSVNLLTNTFTPSNDQSQQRSITKESSGALPKTSISPVIMPGNDPVNNSFNNSEGQVAISIADDVKKIIPGEITLGEPGAISELESSPKIYGSQFSRLENKESSMAITAIASSTPKNSSMPGDLELALADIDGIFHDRINDKIHNEKIGKERNINVAANGSKNAVALSLLDKAWIDDYAFYNRKNKDKWKAKLSMQYYITPSVGFRELYKNNDFEPNAGLLLTTSNVVNDLPQQAAANLEGGVTALLKMNKRLRLKAGIQVNLTNYVTYAHKLEHPTQTTVLLNTDNRYIAPVSYSTNYGNVPGSNLDRLNNKTVQISMPVGADFRIYGNENLKWFIGATIQPSHILSGEAHLISSDHKNYASDPSMLRKWNLNSSVETFVSYKMPSGLNVNVGPQLRYQLMSSYNKQYTYTEKLYNIGVKIGLSTNF
jgi:hypothetical protein